MMQLLFNPNGRIAPNRFLQGITIALGLMIIISIVQVYAGSAGALLGFLTFFAPYPYLCLFGKRLHDSGRSAWWFILFFIGYVILSAVLQNILMPFLAPTAAELQAEMTMLMERGQWMEAFEYAPAIAEASLFLSLVVLIICHVILAGIAFILKSDPNTNRFGPPTRGPAADVF